MEAKSIKTLLAVGAILLAGAAAYANSFPGALLFDDLTTIAQNPSITRLGDLARVLDPPKDLTSGGRPLLNLSLAINYAISGLHPWSYHALNLLIHLAAGLTLFGIVRRTWPRALGGMQEIATWAAAAVAILWVVQPLQVESVTYVVQRAESQMGLFYLLTLYCFIRERRAASVICCLCGMATKEAMASAPVIVLLYDRTFLGASLIEAWRRRRPYYLALFATWIPLALLIAWTGGRAGTVGFTTGVGWWQYVQTQFPAIVRYLWLCVWPQPLIFDYGTEWVKRSADLLPCVAVVALLVAAMIAGLRRRTALGFLLCFFFAVLAPTSLIPGNRQTAAEHRMYLPLAAVACVAVGVAASAWGRRSLALWPAVAVVFGWLTFQRNALYAHPVALWRDTVSKRPDNAYARNNYGSALLAAHLPAAAVLQLEASVRIKPDFLEARTNLGNAFLETGDLPRALQAYRTAVRLNPAVAAVRSNLGVALIAARDYPDARQELQKALELNPHDAEAMNNLGNVYYRMGQDGTAAYWYHRALAEEPGLPQALRSLQLLAKSPPAPRPSTGP